MDLMDLYTKEVNYLNHSNFKASELFCFECEELLTGSIYSRDKMNLCEDCKENAGDDLKAGLVVNSFLKQHLAETEFPCEYYQCDYKGMLLELIDHYDECCWSSIKCPVEDKELKTIALFSKHLSVHAEIEKLTIDSLSMGIDLDVNKLGKRILFVDYKNHYFLVIVNVSEENVSFAVGQHMIIGTPIIDNFKIVHDNGTTNPTLSGKVYSMKALLADNEVQGDDVRSIEKITLDKTACLAFAPKVVLYFSDYELRKTEAVDCPICMHALLGDFRSCTNGHYVCASCAGKISTCTICRCSMNVTNTSLQHLLPNLSFPCMNFEEGCAELIKLSDRNEHNQLCAFRKLLCTVCKMEYTNYNLCDHFEKKHTPDANFSIFSWSFQVAVDIISAEFILYRSHVFCLTARYNTNSILEFYVKAIGECKNNAAKFRYEVLLLNVNDKVVAKCGNVCISDDPNESQESNSYLKLNPCRKYFFASDAWTVRCQVNILFNY